MTRFFTFFIIIVAVFGTQQSFADNTPGTIEPVRSLKSYQDEFEKVNSLKNTQFLLGFGELSLGIVGGLCTLYLFDKPAKSYSVPVGISGAVVGVGSLSLLLFATGPEYVKQEKIASDLSAKIDIMNKKIADDKKRQDELEAEAARVAQEKSDRQKYLKYYNRLQETIPKFKAYAIKNKIPSEIFDLQLTFDLNNYTYPLIKMVDFLAMFYANEDLKNLEVNFDGKTLEITNTTYQSVFVYTFRVADNKASAKVFRSGYNEVSGNSAESQILVLTNLLYKTYQVGTSTDKNVQ